ncbi:hypothetical protein [Bradyrhizobium sp. LVM 105]|uniref:hypothetical protein n=1 Tax=Bradyrhizobium sp. LVM 105 TaxID=2341115 RepID=UPI000F803A28|nr:hypothetical protein [Bradyrhizobium sp. LVM 105]RTE92453.1 hypothetical protein D6B98_13060 [Bradyrhizobium sp. LVM 105]
MDSPQQPPEYKPVLDPKEHLALRVRLAEREHDKETEFGRKANEAAVKAAEEAIKAVILINGGSSVAMLAFIGTVASKDLISPEHLTQVIKPLLFFGSGVAAAVMAAAAAYFTNLMIAGTSNRMSRNYEEPFLRDTASSKRHRVAGECFRYLGVLAMTVAIGFFVSGLVKAKAAFEVIAISKQTTNSR